MKNQLEILKENIEYCWNNSEYHTTNNETRIHNLEERAKKNKFLFMRQGLTLIKPELAEEWIKFVNENSKNDYFAIVIEAIVSIMNKMENGISFMVAQKQTCVDELELSGFQEGAVTCAILHFYDNSKNLSNIKSDEPLVLSYLKK